MPDPTLLNPVAVAEQAQLITPDDAKFLNTVADRRGVDMDLVGKDLSDARKQWDAIHKGADIAEIAKDPMAAEWLLRAHNAASIQDDLGSIVQFRRALKDTELPDPGGVLDLAGAYANASWKKAGLGLATVAALPLSGVQAALGYDTTSGYLTDAAGDVDEQYQARRTDIVDRLMATGGNQFHVVLGDILGQAPEMLASGGASAIAGKAAARPIIRLLGSMAGSETKVALTGMSVLQGVQGSVMNLTARARDNVDAGKDPISARDVAASVAVGAMTALTTRIAGLTGEARLIGGAKATTWGAVARDIATQIGEETSQEVLEVLINDIADGRSSGWDAYKWSAIGGAIGGGLFSAPAVFQKMTSHLPPGQRESEVKILQTMDTLAKTPGTVGNATSLAQQQTILAQSKAIQRGMSLSDLAQLTGTKRTEKQSFDLADFAKVAEAFSVSPEQLAVAWGGKVEGGNVEVNTVAMVYGMRSAKPDQVAVAIEHARKQPDQPSLAEIAERLKDIEAIAAQDDEPALPGGVKDDSDAIAKDVEKEVTAAQAGTKRTAANARADAQIEAARWRAAAVAWNDAYAAAGDTKRVTPKQLYDQRKAVVTAAAEGETTNPAEMAQKDRATYDPARLVAKLGKAADASSVQHELTHHWLEVVRAWAADPAAPAAFKEQLQAIGAWATDKAESIAKHYTATTDKSVSADAIRSAAADMANLNLNSAAGKAIHEGFTGAYEQYLATGKAPTTALKRVFASFRQWMRNIARSLFASDLLSDEAKAIFDRMLTSHDQIAQPHLQALTAESLGMSDEQFAQMESAREDAIRKAQADLEKILERRAKQYAKRDEQELRDGVKALVDAKPSNRARAILKKERLSKAAAHEVIRDPAKQAAIEQFVSDAGLDPQEVANTAGYSTETGSIDMLNALADGKSYDQVLDEAVMEAKTALPPMSMEDRLEELRVSAEGRALAAAVEGAAMRDAIRISKSAKREGVAEGAAAAKADAEVTATEQAALSAERVNAMKVARDAWRTKAKDAATRLRATKAAWDVEGQRILSEMEQDNAELVDDGAAYRVMQKTHSQSALQQEQDALVKRMAKAVKNRSYEEAINAHLEILTLSKMRTILAAKSVQQVKSDAAGRKADTIDALAASAAYDASFMAEMAQDKVARIPAIELREGVWAKRADAARRRREKAVAQQNVSAIMKATTEIMWCETMEAEVIRTLDEKEAMAKAIANGLASVERVKLVYAGIPTIIYYDGDTISKTEQFPTWEAAEQRHANIRGYAIGAVLTRGGDLSNIRDAIDALMSPSRRGDGVAAITAIVNGKAEGIHNMTPRMKGLVDSGRLDPDAWTLEDWVTVQEQMETIQNAAAVRPRQRAEQEAVLKEMFNAVDPKAAPPKQRVAMLGPMRLLANVQSWGLNARSIGVKLGESFDKHIMQPLLAAEAEGFALRRRIGQMVQGKIDAISGPLRKRMDQRYVSNGVETDGWERVSRLLMLGTKTGRDRVVNDLKLRGCTNVSAFLDEAAKGVSQEEVNLISAWWEANAEIWRFQQASAVRAGQTPPKSLAPTPFDVLVDGKPTRLAGGYAAVPYEVAKKSPRILDENGRMVMAFFDDGFMNERVETVNSKLDLSIEAQFNAQLGKIRTAALKPHAHSVSAILTDARFREQAITHYGQDWYDDLVRDVKFAFNGDPDGKNAMNSAAGMVRRAFTFSVYWMNLKTAVSQFSGIVNSAAHPDIGFRAILGSIGNVLHEGAGNFSRRIAQSSYITLMRTHAQDPDYMSPDEVTKSARAYEKYLAAGTWAMRKAQWMVDALTWDAAYQQAKAKNAKKLTDPVALEYHAVAVANKALHETQGSAMRAEQSHINQAELGRMLTFGGKWMLNYGNYLRRQMHAAFAEAKVGDTWEARRAFAKSVLIGLMMNAIAYQAVRALVSPEKDDDEQRDLKDYAWAVGVDVAGTPNHMVRMFAVPVFESFVNNTKTKKQMGGILEVAGEKSLEDAATLMRNVGYVMRGEEREGASLEKIVGQAVSAGSIIIPGLPGTMTKRVMDMDPEQGYEAWVAAVFGWDKTPMRKDE